MPSYKYPFVSFLFQVSEELRPFGRALHLVLGGSQGFEDILLELKNCIEKHSPCTLQTGTAHSILTSGDTYRGFTNGNLPSDDNDLETDGEMEGVVPYEPMFDSSPEHGTHTGKDVRAANRVYGHSPTSEKAGRRLPGPGRPPPSAARQSAVCVVLDEAPWFLEAFVRRLEAVVGAGRAVVWAASSFPGWRPPPFRAVLLTRGLRCPPAVLRAMMDLPAYATFAGRAYTALDTGVLAGMPSPTDGPPVKRIRHKNARKDIWDCRECGEAVARFLVDDLRIGE